MEKEIDSEYGGDDFDGKRKRRNKNVWNEVICLWIIYKKIVVELILFAAPGSPEKEYSTLFSQKLARITRNSIQTLEWIQKREQNAAFTLFMIVKIQLWRCRSIEDEKTNTKSVSMAVWKRKWVRCEILLKIQWGYSMCFSFSFRKKSCIVCSLYFILNLLVKWRLFLRNIWQYNICDLHVGFLFHF